MGGIGNLDIGIIAAYFVLVFAIGIYVSMRTKSGDDLFLGGRSLTWGFIGLSLFASNISTSTIMGLSGAAYSSGISQSVYEWMTGIPMIVAALIFIPLYLRSKITTIPEFLALRYDRRSQVFFSIATILASILVETAGGLYAGAIVLKIFFPDLIIWQTTLVLAVIAGLYTAFGGLKAVVYTDALQAIILIVGCGILTYSMFGKFDFDWDRVLATTSPGHFSVVKLVDDPGLPWPGLLLGVQFLGFWYWTTNQYIVQRVLGAKNIQHARWGAMLAGFLKIIPFAIMVLPGAMAIAVFPNLENGDMIFPTMVTEILPAGLVGLVLAGLISAIMSSVDSTLNSSSTLVVVDFIIPLKKDITEKEISRYGRITTLILMVVAAGWAPMIANFGGIWAYLQQMYSIFVPSVVVLFLVGVFYKNANGHGAFWTLILGTGFGLVSFILRQLEIWTLHYTMAVGIIVLFSVGVFVLVSELTQKSDSKDVSQYIFSRSMVMDGNEGMAWYKNYIYQAGLLLVVIGTMLYFLW